MSVEKTGGGERRKVKIKKCCGQVTEFLTSQTKFGRILEGGLLNCL